jgi:iron complex transport system ATP-binding protein
MDVIEVKDICAGYGYGDVIKKITFKAEQGENLCILGPNGCGKSTLLKTIARIIQYRGTISLEGGDIARCSRKELAKKIALLGQSAQVFFPYTVYETVSLGRYAYTSGFLKNLSDEDRTIIEDTLTKLDLWSIKDRIIDELSGGQLQRVFLARTLVQDPGLILLDEPTNHLDLKHQVEFLEYISHWARENNRTVIAVLHDLNLARRFADTAALMKDGELVSFGKSESVLTGKALEDVYGIDIRAFMLESLERWRGSGD